VGEQQVHRLDLACCCSCLEGSLINVRDSLNEQGAHHVKVITQRCKTQG
jgi:hypothetical protein